jgi:hypothetical protein
MRINLVAASILLLCAGVAHGEVSQKSMFTCINMTSYAVDSDCTSSLISSNMQFQNMQNELEIKLEQQSPNVMATTQFFPNKMLIKVIAQKEQELENPKLLASVQ